MYFLFYIFYLYYSHIRNCLDDCALYMVPKLFLSPIINLYFTINKNLLHFFFYSEEWICPFTLGIFFFFPFKWPGNSIKVMQWRKTALSAQEEPPNKITALIFSLTFLVSWNFMISKEIHSSLKNALFTSSWGFWKQKFWV